MRRTAYITLISLFFIGCSNRDNVAGKLTCGKFYQNLNFSEDTLLFQKIKPKGIKNEWNYLIWNITEDSILQKDSHGLLSCLGEDKCSYSIKNDILNIRYLAKSGWDCKTIQGKQNLKYEIIESNKNEIKLVPILSITKKGPRKIRSDIQLR